MGSNQGPPPCERRHAARVPTQDLRCGQGRVADLSARGMRLVIPSSEAPTEGQPQLYTFRVDSSWCPGVCDIQGLQAEIVIRGVACWVRPDPTDTNSVHVGVMFDAIDTKTRDALVRLAMSEGGTSIDQAMFDHDQLEPIGFVGLKDEDLYAVLGIAPGASEGAVRSAYHALIQEHSRDADESPSAQRILDGAHRAYRVLKDPDARTRYDAQRQLRSQSA